MRTWIVTLALLAGWVPAARAGGTPPDPRDLPQPLTPATPMPPRDPTADELVGDFNKHAERVAWLFARVEIDVKAPGWTADLEGRLAARRWNDVRLVAQLLGRPAVDVGSNRREFWANLTPGTERLLTAGRDSRWYDRHPKADQGWPVADAPDALLDCLNMRPVGYGGSVYEVRRSFGDYFELLLPPSKDARGRTVRKGIILGQGPGGAYWPTDHVLYDADGQVLRRAVLREWLHSSQPNAEPVPTRIDIEWPDEKVSVVLRLKDVKVNEKIDQQRTDLLFRPPADAAATREPENRADGVIVHLSSDAVEARYGEERLRLSGKPDGAMTRKLLGEQLGQWKAKNAGGLTLVVCGNSMEHGRVLDMLTVARQAGFRSIEVKVVGTDAGDEEAFAPPPGRPQR
jgi:hypothetical protein